MAAMVESRPQANKKLLALATRVQATLQSQYGQSGHLTFCGPLKPDAISESGADGPYLDLAWFYGPRFWLGLDYTDYWGDKPRHVWCGLYSAHNKIRGEKWLGPVCKGALQKTRKDTARNGSHRHFASPLSRWEFSKTVVEDYSTWNEFYVGRYWTAEIGDKSLVGEIVSWFGKWLPQLIEEADKKEYKEWRTRHEMGERTHANAMVLALAKKQQAHQCQVCDMKFEHVYGEIGQGYIEAHHVYPGAQQGSKDWLVNVKNLAALCSNFHRMVHRLLARNQAKSVADGHSRVKELRRIVQQHAR